MHKNKQNESNPESPTKRSKRTSFDSPKWHSHAPNIDESTEHKSSPATHLSAFDSKRQSSCFFNANDFFAPDFSFGETEESSEISDCFSPALEKTQFRSNHLKRTNKGSFKIHALSTLRNFLHEMHTNQEKPCFRFLVDTDGQARFAREHNKRFGSPAHYQMTGLNQKSASCMTAGNLFLSDDFKTCVKINNKSGDFRPSFDSLKWFLAILIMHEHNLPFTLPEQLEIERFSESGIVEQKMMWPISSIREWVLDTFDEERLPRALREQGQGAIDVIYTHQIEREACDMSALPKSQISYSTKAKKKLSSLFSNASAQDSQPEVSADNHSLADKREEPRKLF